MREFCGFGPDEIAIIACPTASYFELGGPIPTTAFAPTPRRCVSDSLPDQQAGCPAAATAIPNWTPAWHGLNKPAYVSANASLMTRRNRPKPPDGVPAVTCPRNSRPVLPTRAVGQVRPKAV